MVNNTFYTNAGTEAFKRGNEVGVISDVKMCIGSRIPASYQELDFVQSTGYEYIDTGVCIYNYYDKIKMEVDMQLTPGVTQNEYCYQGVGMAGATGYYFTLPGFYSGDNNIDISFGNSEHADCSARFTDGRDTNRHYMFVDAYNGEVGYDDDIRTGKEYTSVSSGLGTGNINLFAIRSYDQYARNYIKMRLYGCTITDMSTNTKLREFVPCYRMSDDVVGLYDLVSGTFFTNQGTGAFRKGNESNRVKKIEIDVNGQTKEVARITDSNGVVIYKTKLPPEYQEVEYPCLPEKKVQENLQLHWILLRMHKYYSKKNLMKNIMV